MRKFLVLVMMASLVTAGAAFAGERSLVAQPDATFQFGVGGVASGPSSTNNDDTCDISVAPAATLLLPYFEVETNPAIDRSQARSTLFTITNVSAVNQIAKITLWTDWSYPVLDFNVWLSPYDVQSINLRDVIVGFPNAANQPIPTIAPPSGTSGAAASNVRNVANPNHVVGPPTAATNCTGLFGAIPADIAAAVRSTLVTGLPPATGPGSQFYCFSTPPPTPTRVPIAVGNNHGTLAIGYATIDVVNNCTTTLPTTASYYTTEILFDNVLIGDYQDINTVAQRNDAGGNPLVHIRAVPEGGPAGSRPVDALGAPATTNLPYTFYDRYTTGLVDRRFDRRQPLPSTFAAHYISSTALSFNTDFKIWREGITGNEGVTPTAPPGCEIIAPNLPPAGFTAPASFYANNARLGITDVVRFDERENATTVAGTNQIISPAPTTAIQALPETSRVSMNNAAGTLPAISGVSSFAFPAAPSGDPGGWIYWNLNNGGSTGAAAGTVAYSARNSTAAVAPPAGFATTGVVAGARGSQNWVIIAMQASVTGGTFSADFDAAWLGNGCTPAAARTTGTGLAGSGTGINPAGGLAGTCVPGAAGCVNPNVTP